MEAGGRGGAGPAGRGSDAGRSGGRRRRSPWSRFVDSAVQGQGTEEKGPADTGPAARATPARQRGLREYRSRVTAHALARVRARIADAGGTQEDAGSRSAGPRRRTDLRLVLPAALVWGASLAGLWLPPPGLAALCCALAASGGLFLAWAAKGGQRGRACRARPAVVRAMPQMTVRSRRRSLSAAVGASLLLAAAGAAHSATASSQRFDGPLAEAVAAGRSAVAVVEVAGSPRLLPGPGGAAQRWAVPVWTRELATGGILVRTRARLVVMGGGDWGTVLPGQNFRATGRLRAAEPGNQEAGILAASSAPGRATAGLVLEAAAADLRGGYRDASAFLGPDARGLLPGMVTGDTSALDEGLGNAMKLVGMTHLTAVSGANCSLVLGALLLACRSCRLPRAPAAATALGGLGLFVVLVGPDASVLRAALMGAIGAASLAGGRAGRGLSFLCLAVTGLLLADPVLGASIGFLLSVLATLGIIVLGRRIMDWVPPGIPRWAAAAVAVPLSAQLLCGPVIVLLQPQFTTYALLANILVSPLVAPVTLLGTAAVPLVAVLPWLAAALIAVAGTFSAGIAATARFAAQLPGAVLPWPAGVPGLLSMALLSLLTVAAVWAAVRPRRVCAWARGAHAWIEAGIAVLQCRLAAARLRMGADRGRGRRQPQSFEGRSGKDPPAAAEQMRGPGPASHIAASGAAPPCQGRAGASGLPLHQTGLMPPRPTAPAQENIDGRGPG